ncbi:hypothetical protein [Streptomyces katsurahamanus]|uniref:Secreted protein n=1 Tax=Streptomyces katsurahamanus TaxID=2577098 RepID=A0ABW9NX72_9ACTN|nr:hypothetical protein [Streptomyces katsurahamanus]MQS37913.1 hypothetical protein [Streptomyces katsurahamanus]
MPRPTAAQLAYGSATVVLSALALLLFTRTTEVLGVAAIGVVSLALGLLVATVVPLTRALRAARAARTPARRGRVAPAVAPSSAARPAASREPAGVGEPSAHG